jgi:ZIP family zinc transporter
VEALAAGFWGFVGGASLLLGALAGVYVGASTRLIATVMALGAGVLIFERKYMRAVSSLVRR